MWRRRRWRRRRRRSNGAPRVSDGGRFMRHHLQGARAAGGGRAARAGPSSRRAGSKTAALAGGRGRRPPRPAPCITVPATLAPPTPTRPEHLLLSTANFRKRRKIWACVRAWQVWADHHRLPTRPARGITAAGGQNVDGTQHTDSIRLRFLSARTPMRTRGGLTSRPAGLPSRRKPMSSVVVLGGGVGRALAR